MHRQKSWAGRALLLLFASQPSCPSHLIISMSVCPGGTSVCLCVYSRARDEKRRECGRSECVLCRRAHLSSPMYDFCWCTGIHALFWGCYSVTATTSEQHLLSCTAVPDPSLSHSLKSDLLFSQTLLFNVFLVPPRSFSLSSSSLIEPPSMLLLLQKARPVYCCAMGKVFFVRRCCTSKDIRWWW